VTAEASETPSPSASDAAALSEALREEYRLLGTMLSTIWSASLSRVSLFLGVVSAIGVALGFVAQDGGAFGSTFTLFALVALPIALLLGLGTFVRSIELQREGYVYIAGLNRIRHAIVDSMPESRPYFVLSIHDDPTGVFRSQGTGIRLKPPRVQLVFALVQTQGIVAVICAALAGIIGGLATATFAPAVAWIVGAVAFVVVLVLMLAYWNRKFSEIQKTVKPLFPTPPQERDSLI
jgi:hypothetical protein